MKGELVFQSAFGLMCLLACGLYVFLGRRSRRLTLLAIGLTAALVLPAIVLGAGWGSYGTGMFALLPLLTGFFSVLLDSREDRRSLQRCIAVSSLAALVLSLGLLVMGIEGLICVLMAAVLGLPLAWLGGAVAFFVQRRFWIRREAAALLVLLALAAPLLLMGAEPAVRSAPLVREVRTAVVVDAPPEVVWRHVVAFEELPPPTEWLFRAGVAYPLRTEIDGTGPGAARRCVLSTGVMPETVEVWDAPRLLRFAVHRTPPSMRELSPWGDIHPHHLEGFFESVRGQFRLVPLPGGRTKVEGTSWYRQRFYPAAYWRLWCDAIVHDVHARVLANVKALSEAEARRSPRDV